MIYFSKKTKNPDKMQPVLVLPYYQTAITLFVKLEQKCGFENEDSQILLLRIQRLSLNIQSCIQGQLWLS